MKMDKVLIRLYIPMLEEKYDMWIPLNKKIDDVVKLLIKAIDELSGGKYKPDKMPILYNKVTDEAYDVNLIVNESTIRNGTSLMLI